MLPWLTRLRDRLWVRTAIAYAVVAWVLLQIISIIAEPLGLPRESLAVAIIAICCGFPFAVLLAWAYERPRTGSGVAHWYQRVGPLRLLAAIGVAILGGVVAHWWLQKLSAAEQPTVARVTLAVLPFVNMSGDPGNDYLGDGLSEELSSQLARVPGLAVVARTSAFAYKGKELDIAQIGKALGVRNVLEGSVRRRGNQLRVTAQLIDVSTGFHIWADSYDRELGDLFDIQDDISQNVTDALSIVLSPQAARDLSAPPTGSIAAYDTYLQGLAQLRQPDSVQSLNEAARLFRRALVEDKTFARAYAGLCRTFVARYQLDKSAPFIGGAEEACRQAVTLDTAMSEGHLALGDLYVSTGAYVSAESEYRKALRRNPQDPDAYTGLARSLGLQNRLPEAEEVYRQAITIRPTDWNVQSRFAAYLFENGRIAEAVPYFRRVTELVPADPRGWSNLGGAQLMTADFSSAAESFSHSVTLQPTSESYSNLGTMYYYLRRFDAAAEAYRQAAELSPNDYRIAGNLADALQSSGDAAGARQSYERARNGAQAAVEVNARDADAQAHLAYNLGRLGNVDEARSAAAIAAELAPNNMYVQYYVALVHLGAGDKVAALASLRRAVDLGYPQQLLAPAPELEPLQSEPEFRKLIKR